MTKQSDDRVKLSRLRRAGLYRAKNPRGPITRSGKRAIDKFDVWLRGDAKIVSLGRGNAARKLARDMSFEFGNTNVIASNNRIIVRAKKHERIKVNKKLLSISIARPVGKEGYYTRELISLADRDNLDKLLKGENAKSSISVPFMRKSGVIEYQNFTRDEYLAFKNQYQNKYKNMQNYIELFRYTKNVATS